MSVFSSEGTLLRGSGGLYLVRLDKSASPLSGMTVQTRARGTLRRGGLLVGDRVTVEYSDSSFTGKDGAYAPLDDASGLPDCAICGVLPRRNELIRPAMSNLDNLFITCAAARPEPDLLTIDKLLSVSEYYGITAAVVIGKSDLSADSAKKLSDIYKRAGYPVFTLSCLENTGTDELREYVNENCPGRISAFSGASGVGKSTLLSVLFPSLGLETGDISRKTGRGKHTTRRIDLYPVALPGGDALLADTPGFSNIDFENFDFLPFESLPDTMRDFLPFYADCRYQDCSHTRERECGVSMALAEGKISRSRHESYLAMYDILRKKEQNRYG